MADPGFPNPKGEGTNLFLANFSEKQESIPVGCIYPLFWFLGVHPPKDNTSHTLPKDHTPQGPHP